MRQIGMNHAKKWAHQNNVVLSHILLVNLAKYAPGQQHTHQVLGKLAYSMPAPRPLGVRRAVAGKRHLVHSPNLLPAHRPLNPEKGSGFGALQRAPHPHCARLQTLKILNVGFAI